MFTQKTGNDRKNSGKWLSLTFTLRFMFGHMSILGLSLLLMLCTALLTWLGYLVTVHFVDGLTGHFFQQAPAAAGIVGWFKLKGWWVLKWFFLVLSRLIAFYLAFLISYSLTSPGYAFLSLSAEKKYLGQDFTADQGFTWAGMVKDLVEGFKIGAFGLVVTVAALLLNLLPVVGAGLVILLYIFYSALMFIDYPASRQRWSLGDKLGWIGRRWPRALRLGWLPALISMIPVLNIFFMALFFPLFTVHATLNFIAPPAGGKE
ncbi:MAG: EI24 domain-containing protein [Deltaproteobacteria bacterium]|nr:EI24 domain-containing protein [Deltaproteobacteria bacterium]